MATASTASSSATTTTTSVSGTYPGASYQPDYTWQGYNPWTYQPSHSGYQQPPVDLNAPFAQWLLSEGITDTNTKTLLGNGITCKRTLSLLTSEDMHVLAVQPLGQRRLLEFLVRDGPPATPTHRLTSQDHQKSHDQDPVMASLGHLLGRQCSSSDDGESLDSYIPPFAIAGGKKHLDITEFVRCFNIVDERVLAASDGDMQVLIRGAGSSKPKLDDVSPLAWMGASLRILRALIRKGDLAVKDLDNYLTYMEKISDLSAKYTWSSMRIYDREYRRWQAQTGVSWLQDNSHLAEAYLYVRQDAAKVNPMAMRSLRAPATKTRQQSDHQGQICRQFNFGNCQFGNACRYQHICLKPQCQQAHAIVNHNTPKNQTPQ